MPTDTKVNDLIINVLTEEQYASIPAASVSLTELYLVPEVIDTVPISGSSNPITSGGVYDAIQEIPEQVNADWNATSGPAQILNKPGNAEFGQILVSTRVSNTVNATAINVSFSGYKLADGAIVSLWFHNTVPANATLNINNTGAKSIYYNEELLKANVINANDRCLFMYSATTDKYYLLSKDSWDTDYVKVHPTDSAYNNNVAWNIRTGSGFNGKYIRITFPDSAVGVWGFIYMDLTILQDYNLSKYGKMALYAAQNPNQEEWNSLSANLSDTLTNNITIYGYGRKYLYIGGLYSYSAVSINKIMVTDAIHNRDLTGITIDTVDSLPENCFVGTVSGTGSTISWDSTGLSLKNAYGDKLTTIDNASISNILEIPTTASDVSALPSTTKYGASISLDINSSTYVVTAQLKDQDGNNLGEADTIDLPLESVVVGGSYDSSNKKVILTLQNGNTVAFDISDLISGLQNEITPENPLSADLVVDGTSNKIMTASERTKLSSINPTNPSNNQVLIYSSSNSQWVNSSLYWADLPIQTASNKTTSPTFGDVRVSENDLYIGASTASQCHQQYDASLQCLKFIFD